MAINSLGSSLQKGGESLKERVSRMAKLAIIPLFLMVAPMVKGQWVGINPTWAAPDPNAMLDVAGWATYVDDLRIRNTIPGPNGGFAWLSLTGDVYPINLSGLATQYLDGTGNFSTPPGASKWTLSGTMLSPNNIADNVNIGKTTPTNANKLAVSGGGVSIGSNFFTNTAAPVNWLNVFWVTSIGPSAWTSRFNVRLGSGDAEDAFNVDKWGVPASNPFFRITNTWFAGFGTDTPWQKVDIRNGFQRFSRSPDALDTWGWYDITHAYMSWWAWYKILSFDASNPLGPWSFSFAKIDFNRETMSLGRNTNAFSDIPLLSTVVYINPAGSSAGYDKYAAIFDSRTTVPSSSVTAAVSPKHQASVLIYGNINDVSWALQDPVALETIGWWLAVNGIIKEDSYPVGRWLWSFAAAPVAPTWWLKNGDMYYNTASFSLCVYDLPNTARRCCN